MSTENSSFSKIACYIQQAFKNLWRDAKIQNFSKQVSVDQNGCWIPKIVPNFKGYCYVNVGGRKGKHVRLHRWAYMQVIGAQNSLVLHKCDNRACFNPDHLYAGNAKDNTRDMMLKRRGANQSSVGYGWSK